MFPNLLMVLSAAMILLGVTKFYGDWLNFSDPRSWPAAGRSGDILNSASGGIVMIFVAAALWAYLVWPPTPQQSVFLACLLILVTVTFIHEHSELPWVVYKIPQFLAIFAVLYSISPDKSLLPFELSIPIERVIVALLWLGFMNVFQTQDEIDGLVTMETVSIAFGAALVYSVTPVQSQNLYLALIIVGAAAGFLRWNCFPAKVKLGNAGAVGLAFALGWMLIDLMVHGFWAAAFILPLVILADVTATFVNKLLEKEWPDDFLAEQYCVRAFRVDENHSAVLNPVLFTNLILVGLALISVRWPWPTVVFAGILMFVLLGRFRDETEQSRQQEPISPKVNPQRRKNPFIARLSTIMAHGLRSIKRWFMFVQLLSQTRFPPARLSWAKRTR